MDLVIRFWENNEAQTRYLTSVFLGHATAENLLTSFKSAQKNNGLELNNMIQVSMDGPNVN